MPDRTKKFMHDPEGTRLSLFRRERAEELRQEATEAIAEKDALLGAVFDSALDGMFIIDRAGRYVDVNPAGALMFGYTRDEFVSSDISLLLFPEDVDAAFERGQSTWRDGRFIPEFRMRKKDGSEIWVEMTVNPIRAGGEEYALGVKRDITEKRRRKQVEQEAKYELEEKVRERTADLRRLNEALAVEVSERLKADYVLRAIVEGTSAVAGSEFFRTLVEKLASTLGFRHAIVGELTADGEKVSTLAWWGEGRLLDNIEYGLKGTPCENVVGKKTCVYPKGVQDLFPGDKPLKDLGIESYIGVPLFGSNGEALGIILAMDDKPVDESSRAEAIVEIFARRAAFEIERLRLEEDKQKTTDTLHAIVDNSQAAIFLKDPDGRLVFVNKWHEEFFGRKREEIVGEFDNDHFPEGFAEKIRADDMAVIKAGKPLNFEDRLVHPDGTEHIYQTTKFPIPGMPGFVCGIATDVTEIKRTTERLNEAQHLAGVGSWEYSIKDDTDAHSDEMYRIIGRPPEEFKGGEKAFLSIVHPDDRVRVDRAMKEAVAGKDGFSIEYRIVLPDGTVRHVHDRARVVYDEAGAPVRFFGTMQDITERKKTEEELLRAQKLDTVGTMAGRFAHDFNNILLGVIGNASVAKELAGPGGKVSELLSDIEAAAERAKSLTRQFLTFSKGGAPVKEAVNAAGFINDNACMVLKGSRVECECTAHEGLWDVEVDEVQIAQVMNNVVLNAAEAMPDGGTVVVAAENYEATEKDSPALAPGRYVLIKVRDTGHGIPKKNLTKIFEPFFTTKQKASGLGLAVTYSVVKKHGGHIAVESEEGKGSTFKIFLPSPEREASANAEPVTAPAKGARVLVMDDEELVRDVAGEMLKLMDIEAAFAAEGAEAVGMYREAMHAGRPYDAVIMDLTIPGGMGGVEALKELRAIDPDVRAVVSSGFSRDPVMSEFKQYGFSGVITKPYRVADFRKILSSVLSEKK